MNDTVDSTEHAGSGTSAAEQTLPASGKAPPVGESVPDGTPGTSHPSTGSRSWLARSRLTTSRGALVLGILLILVGGLVANTAQTAGGRIKIEPVRFMAQSGIMQTGLLYVPSNATIQHPACGVVTLHGYINSVDTMDGFSIEMARRGCVVLDANLTGQGDSEPPFLGPTDTDYGGYGALEFINTLPIVRTGDVGLIGHSMGGWASVVAADFGPKLYRSMVLESSSVSTPVYEPVLGTPQFPRNVLVDEAQYSEFATVMWDVPAGKDFPESKRMQSFFGTANPIVKGKIYGSVAAGTARELLVQGTIHPGITIDPSAVKHAVQWMQLTLKGVQKMPAGNQIWYWDEIGTLLALLGVGLLFFGAAGELLRLPYFATVARPRPENRSMHGILWWVGAAILVAVGPVTFYWLQDWRTNEQSAGSFWPENVTSGVATWALAGAAIAIILFLLWHFTTRRSKRGTLHTYGITEPDGRIDGKLIWRSIVLGLTTVVITYLGVYFFEWAWNSDVRFWVFNIKPVDYTRMKVAVDYMWPFLIYFIVLSVVVFGQLRPRMKRLGTFMLAVTVLLTIGYVGFLGVEYGMALATGMIMTSSQPLLTIVGFQFVPVYIIVGTVASYLFWKTGRIYTGVAVLTLLIPAILVASTAVQGAPW